MPRPKQTLIDDAKAIADLVRLDIDKIKDNEMRILGAINKMVVAEVIMRYTLLDEILSELIVRYFFKVDLDTVHFAEAWQTQDSTIFTHHILDEMFLLKKLSVAHAIKPVSGKVTGIIQNINAVRNSLAHSFFPENRKEYKATGKVLYRKKDIRTPEGLMVFQEDAETAFRHIEERIYGTVD